MSNDTYCKVFCVPHPGEVVEVIPICMKINASIFRTGNCGGRKFIHILTVCAILICCDAQTTLQ